MRRLLYRWGWDTGGRNRAAARVICAVIRELEEPDEEPLLDVGCGDAGMAAFLYGVSVVGVDLEEPPRTPSNLTFVTGSITDLPFPDQSFAFVSSIDVLENLPPEARDRAIGELMRVARRGVLIACPHGENAARCDAEFRSELVHRGRPAPQWLDEHEANPFPTVDGLVDSVHAVDRHARISLTYSEPTGVCRLVRAAAARSDVLYVATNLLLGLMMPIIPIPQPDASYRVILFARLAASSAV